MPSNPNKELPLCQDVECEPPYGGKTNCEFHTAGYCTADTSLLNVDLRICTMARTSAIGYPVDRGFLVKKGSVISAKVTPSFEWASKGYYNLRNRLIAEGVITDRVFQVDYMFSSPTAAAAVVAGRTVSGTVAWTLIRSHLNVDGTRKWIPGRKKPENSRTVRQWALQGRVPKEGAKPSYIWDDSYGNIRTVYYLDVDTRAMTSEERELFEKRERMKKEHTARRR